MGRAYRIRVVPHGDSAVMVLCGTRISKAAHRRVAWVVDVLRERRLSGVLELTPGYISVLVTVDGMRTAPGAMAVQLADVLEGASNQRRLSTSEQRILDIPVFYGDAFGPDLAEVAHLHSLSPDALIQAHTDALYQVYLIGFTPGFPYLAGLPKGLETPRRQVPRLQVPAGSVGIGGKQTGVYPVNSPGGWQIIGQTPLKLFDITRDEPFLLRPDDLVRFVRTDEARSESMQRIAGSGIDRGLVSPGESVAGLQTDSLLPQSSGATRSYSARPARDAVLEVVKSGLLTSVQDLGRGGYTAEGVARGGVMDKFAAMAGNLLLGNPANAAVLECTLLGPTLRFLQKTIICITGANLVAELNGKTLPLWQTVPVDGGDELRFAGHKAGCRAYVSILGGFDVPVVMGSRSTDLAQGFGGHEGRALRQGDVLFSGVLTDSDLRGSLRRVRRGLPHWARPVYTNGSPVGYLPAQTPSTVDNEIQAKLARTVWRVTPDSNRMGLRLGAEQPLGVKPRSIVSEPVQPGTIQCPPGGSPIVLMADAQTVGGYPVAGVVCTADLSKVAQVPPGGTLSFESVTEQTALAKLRAQLDILKWIAIAVK